MSPYIPAALADAPEGRFTQLVQAAKQRRLVLYLGAGISMSPPSCGPTGPAVADVLRPLVARMVKTRDEDLDGLSLEELAQKVADGPRERLAELRERAAVAFDFRGIAPNFGHEVAALLLREGLVQLISVNWDCGIERAGARAGVGIQGVADVAESVQLSHNLPLYKVHGCATRPWTLAITQDDVDRPQSWAVGRTQGALAGGVVVFVGLGTIGVYVSEPFAESWRHGHHRRQRSLLSTRSCLWHGVTRSARTRRARRTSSARPTRFSTGCCGRSCAMRLTASSSWPEIWLSTRYGRRRWSRGSARFASAWASLRLTALCGGGATAW